MYVFSKLIHTIYILEHHQKTLTNLLVNLLKFLLNLIVNQQLRKLTSLKYPNKLVMQIVNNRATATTPWFLFLLT